MRVVVVGGGIAGASATYHLSCRGVQSVLVDRADSGQATAAGAGIVWPWLSASRDPDKRDIALEAAGYFPGLTARLAEEGYHTGYARVGGLFVSHDSDGLERVHKALAEGRRPDVTGTRVSLLTPGQPRDLFPALSPDLSGVHDEAAARVDGRLLRDALRRSATRHGGADLTGTVELQVSGDRVTGVVMQGEEISADAVIVAAGAWSAELLRPFGMELPVEPQRGQIVHVDIPGARTGSWPVVQPDSSHYLLTFPDSRVVFGATRETGSGFDDRVTAGGLAEVLDEALTVAPGLSVATHVETRVGFRPSTQDGRPLIGTIDGIEGLIIATGFGARGLTIGPYAGRLAAQLALGEQPSTDLAPYDPLREQDV